MLSNWYAMRKHKQNFHQHLIHNFLDTSLPWYHQEFPRLTATTSTGGGGADLLVSLSSLSFKSDMTLSISMNEAANWTSLEDYRVWILQDGTIMPTSVSFAFGRLICLTNLRAHTEAATSPNGSTDGSSVVSKLFQHVCHCLMLNILLTGRAHFLMA